MYAALAAAFTVAKISLQYANPYFLIAVRMLLAGSVFLLFQYLFNSKKFFVRKEDFWLFVKTSFFYIYLAFIPEFWALQYLSSSKVVILYSITPFIAAGLAYFLVSEKLTFKKVFGMIIGFTGIIPILLTHNQEGLTKELLSISKAEAILLIAIFSAAYGWFPVKQLMTKGYSLPMINGTTMFLGGAGALVTSFAVEGVFTRHVFAIKPFLFWVIILIILANGIFYNMYGWLLKRYSFTMLSFAGFLCPIFGSLYGFYFLKEPITWNHFASIILISSGLFLFYQEELKRKK
jgi:drug/metabolite transporter (DMT)-like permease